MTAHRFPCASDDCPACETEAERRAEDIEPDYDLDGAADQYERWLAL
jgi:hypothetical protein